MEVILHDLKPRCVCLTELGLSKPEFEALNLSGYVRVGGYQREAGRWGGVGWFTENVANSRSVEDFEKMGKDFDCELAAIEVRLETSEKLLLIGVYM